MKWTSQPTQRDQEIYQAVAISLRPQREVAKLFGVTQGRVSQICKQLRQWLAVQIHSAASPAEDNFIAAHELRLRLEDRLRLASEVFAESRDPEVTIKHRLTQQEGKPDVTVDESITRGARANHQMFREISRLDEQHYQACLRESQGGTRRRRVAIALVAWRSARAALSGPVSASGDDVSDRHRARPDARAAAAVRADESVGKSPPECVAGGA